MPFSSSRQLMLVFKNFMRLSDKPGHEHQKCSGVMFSVGCPQPTQGVETGICIRFPWEPIGQCPVIAKITFLREFLLREIRVLDAFAYNTLYTFLATTQESIENHLFLQFSFIFEKRYSLPKQTGRGTLAAHEK